MNKFDRAKVLLQNLKNHFAYEDGYGVEYRYLYLEELNNIAIEVVWHDETNPIFLAGVLKHEMIGCFGDCFPLPDYKYLELVEGV